VDLDQFSMMKRLARGKRLRFLQFSDVRVFLRFIYRHSKIYSSRIKFLKLLVLALFKFPHRFRDFVFTFAVVEHVSQYRHTIKQQLIARMESCDDGTIDIKNCFLERNKM